MNITAFGMNRKQLCDSRPKTWRPLVEGGGRNDVGI